MPWTGRACAESCSRHRPRRATSCFCSQTSPKRSPIPIWRMSGPRKGPTCAFRRRAKAPKWRCSAYSTGRVATSLFTPAGPNEARTSSRFWRRSTVAMVPSSASRSSPSCSSWTTARSTPARQAAPRSPSAHTGSPSSGCRNTPRSSTTLKGSGATSSGITSLIKRSPDRTISTGPSTKRLESSTPSETAIRWPTTELLLRRGLSSILAFWLRSCGVAECVGDAVEQRGSELLHLWRDLGREETLFPPDLAADSGERVGEGRALLAIPSSRRDRQTLLEAEPGGQERDQGEQPEQTRRGARDRLVRPLALGLDAEVVTHVPEGDFHLPALDEPGQDLQRIAGEVGAE